MEEPGPTRAAPAGGVVAGARPAYGAGGLAARVVITLIGSAGLIVGAFLVWLKAGPQGASLTGVHLTARAFFSTELRIGHFAKSAGLAMIVLGLVAIVGLAPRSGWLTRLAGVLGIVGFVLFLIEVLRAPGFKVPTSIGIGAWVCLAGGAVALIGGFFGSRRRMAVTAGPPAASAPPRSAPPASAPPGSGAPPPP